MYKIQVNVKTDKPGVENVYSHDAEHAYIDGDGNLKVGAQRAIANYPSSDWCRYQVNKES